MSNHVTIMFASYKALVAFHSMAEGMWEVRRDDRDPEGAARLAQLIEQTGEAATETATYPVTVELAAEQIDDAEAVLENCLDNATPGDEDDLAQGDVVISRTPTP
jgi:hypothetical protein